MKTWHIVVGLAVVGVAGVIVYKITRPAVSSGDGYAPPLDASDPNAAPQLQPATVYVQPAPAPTVTVAAAPIPAQPAAAYATNDPRAGGVDTADTSMNGWGEYESGGYH